MHLVKQAARQRSSYLWYNGEQQYICKCDSWSFEKE